MKTISKFQYNSISFLLSLTMFFGVGLSRIVTLSEETFWLSIVIGIGLGTIIVLILEKILYNKEDVSIIDEKNKFNSLIHILISIVYIIISLAILTNLIISIYLTEFNPIMIALPLILLMIYGVFKGKSVIARVSVIFFTFCLFLALNIIITLAPQVKLDNFLPIFNVSSTNVIKSAIYFAIYSTSPLLLLGIFRKNEVVNISKHQMLKNYLASSLLIMTMFVFTVGVMGVNLTTLYRYPEYIVIKRISILDFINNLENVDAFYWVFIYIVFLLISSLFLKKSLDNFSNKWYVYIIIYSLIFILLIFTFLKDISYILWLFRYLYLILGICLFVFIVINLKRIKK